MSSLCIKKVSQIKYITCSNIQIFSSSGVAHLAAKQLHTIAVWLAAQLTAQLAAQQALQLAAQLAPQLAAQLATYCDGSGECHS